MMGEGCESSCTKRVLQHVGPFSSRCACVCACVCVCVCVCVWGGGSTDGMVFLVQCVVQLFHVHRLSCKPAERVGSLVHVALKPRYQRLPAWGQGSVVMVRC
jgi:hypothetical protein